MAVELYKHLFDTEQSVRQLIEEARIRLRCVTDEEVVRAAAEIRDKISAAVGSPALRLECLRIAQGDVGVAQKMYDFVAGTSNAVA